MLNLQERRIVEHSRDSIDDPERSLIDLQPHIQSGEYLRSKVLAGQRHHVVKWPCDSLYFRSER